MKMERYRKSNETSVVFPVITPGVGPKLYCLFVCFHVPLVTVLYCKFQSRARIPVYYKLHVWHELEKRTKDKTEPLLYMFCFYCHIY